MHPFSKWSCIQLWSVYLKKEQNRNLHLCLQNIILPQQKKKNPPLPFHCLEFGPKGHSPKSPVRIWMKLSCTQKQAAVERFRKTCHQQDLVIWSGLNKWLKVEVIGIRLESSRNPMKRLLRPVILWPCIGLFSMKFWFDRAIVAEKIRNWKQRNSNLEMLFYAKCYAASCSFPFGTSRSILPSPPKKTASQCPANNAAVTDGRPGIRPTGSKSSHYFSLRIFHLRKSKPLALCKSQPWYFNKIQDTLLV